jgi:hypothetical protein
VSQSRVDVVQQRAHVRELQLVTFEARHPPRKS